MEFFVGLQEESDGHLETHDALYFEDLFLMNTRIKESKVMSQHFKH